MLQQPKEHSKDILVVCSKCHLQIGKGIRHNCVIENASSNILSSIDTLPDKVNDQIASGLPKKKAESMCSNISSNSKHKNVSLPLTTQSSM